MLRRSSLQRLPWLVLALALSGTACATEVLRVLSWPGYADADVVQAFEARTGARVEVTQVDSDETMWQKLSTNDETDYDVFAVNTAELQRYIDRGVAVAIDPAALPNLGAQLPRFRNPATLPGTTRDGKLYAIPYAWAEMGLIYDWRQFVRATPVHRRAVGRPLPRQGAGVQQRLAQLLARRTDAGQGIAFRLDAADWAPAVERLVELRRNLLTFYAQPEESARLFVSRCAALMYANYGTQQLQLLRAAGADVGYAIPREGALAWLDCWVVTRGARNQELALAWIDHLLGTGPAHVLSARHGLDNTRDPAPHQAETDRLVWLERVEDVERRNLLWERIRSGDRGARVLAP